MARIIFYHPLPLADSPTSGSQLRPVRMLQAFRDEGFLVDPVVGSSKDRRRHMQRIRSRMRSGVEYAFMYAESATVPIPLSDPHHLPVRPLQDALFFEELSRQQISIGLFYRDVYWQVEELKYKGPLWKRLPKRAFLWLEWFLYRRCVDHLFLPTESIRSLLPTEWSPERLSALPPGCDDQTSGQIQVDLNREDEPLRLFYVGGVTPPYYDLRPLFEVVSRVKGLQLTLCCRKWEWKEQETTYRVQDREDVEVVHAHSNEIERYYRAADLAADFRRPEGYLRTALPIKVVEAIGYGVPSVMLRGTEAAAFVEDEGVGWTFNSLSEAGAGLRHLRDHRDEIAERYKQIKAARPRHTWQARARQAAAVLTGSTSANNRDVERNPKGEKIRVKSRTGT